MNIKLIDYFAAHALEGIISQTPSHIFELGRTPEPDEAADVAYQYAVAMMRERRKVSGSLRRPDDEIDAQLDHDTDHKEAEWLATK
jgi:hypothetical protein|tara:strand:+ start:260 stop:517 length:258 start_codon:yes stop_codon:yes gene_type:complete